MGLFDGFNPVPKPSHRRNKPTAKQRGQFSAKTIQAILARDNFKCVCCGSHYVESVPHHIIFRSQGGTGDKRNGATVDRLCHDWAHGKRKGPNGEPEKEGREWFENWQETKLDENGDLKHV